LYQAVVDIRDSQEHQVSSAFRVRQDVQAILECLDILVFQDIQGCQELEDIVDILG
jgi:hypothetical protein